MSCLLRWRPRSRRAPRITLPAPASACSGRSGGSRWQPERPGPDPEQDQPEDVGVRDRPAELPGVDPLGKVVPLGPPAVAVTDPEPLDGHRPAGREPDDDEPSRTCPAVDAAAGTDE